MKKYVLPMAVLYLSAVTAAWAVPGSTLPQLTGPTDLVQVGSNKGKSHKGNSHNKHHNNNHHNNNHHYSYHGHDYGHRYSYRPRGAIGCVMAGPVWYCP